MAKRHRGQVVDPAMSDVPFPVPPTRGGCSTAKYTRNAPNVGVDFGNDQQGGKDYRSSSAVFCLVKYYNVTYRLKCYKPQNGHTDSMNRESEHRWSKVKRINEDLYIFRNICLWIIVMMYIYVNRLSKEYILSVIGYRGCDLFVGVYLIYTMTLHTTWYKLILLISVRDRIMKYMCDNSWLEIYLTPFIYFCRVYVSEIVTHTKWKRTPGKSSLNTERITSKQSGIEYKHTDDAELKTDILNVELVIICVNRAHGGYPRQVCGNSTRMRMKRHLESVCRNILMHDSLSMQVSSPCALEDLSWYMCKIWRTTIWLDKCLVLCVDELVIYISIGVEQRFGYVNKTNAIWEV